MNRLLLAAILACAALVVHFSVPFAHLVFEEEDGTSHSATYWPVSFSDREAEFDPVPGGSMGYMWTGLALMTAGIASLWAVQTFARSILWTGVSAGAGLLGATMTMHTQGLWLGRMVATVANVILGTDGPSKKHLSEAFSGDFYTHVWIISPWLVLALAIAAVWLVLRALVDTVPEDKGRQVQAQRHASMGRFAILAFVVLLLAPWSVQDLDDNTPAANAQDKDPFVFSLYDTLRIRTDTSEVAKDVGEAGLEEYSELAMLHMLLVIGAMACLLLSMLGVLGNWLGANDEGTTGRMLESGMYVNGLLLVGLVILVGLGAFIWHVPNARVEATRTWAPLVALPLLIVGLTRTLAIYKELAESGDRLVVDEFPEPIVYD